MTTPKLPVGCVSEFQGHDLNTNALISLTSDVKRPEAALTPPDPGGTSPVGSPRRKSRRVPPPLRGLEDGIQCRSYFGTFLIASVLIPENWFVPLNSDRRSIGNFEGLLRRLTSPRGRRYIIDRKQDYRAQRRV